MKREIHLMLIGGAGYDIRDVEKFLGSIQFHKLQQYLSDKSVFVCGHAKDGDGNEVHCVYKTDLEAFMGTVS